MKTRLTLRAGHAGTKRLTDIYGDSLLYIRYRYNEETRERLKTIELIIERSKWEPPEPRFQPATVVSLRIAGYELEARKWAKAAGAIWDSSKRLWLVRYGSIAGSQLERYIHIDENSPGNLL